MTKKIPLFGAVVGQLSQGTRKNAHPLAGAIVTHFSQRTRKMGHPTIVMLKRRIPTAGMVGGAGIPRAWNDGENEGDSSFSVQPDQQVRSVQRGMGSAALSRRGICFLPRSGVYWCLETVV